MDNLDLKAFSPISWMSMSSIKILPSLSANLNNAFIMDDFPAPVLPTIPTLKKKNSITVGNSRMFESTYKLMSYSITFSIGCIWKLRFFNIY